MEVITGSAHASFTMEDSTRVGQARRHAATLCDDAGFSELDAGRVAIVVTELAGNLVRHAKDGKLLLSLRGRGEVEVIAVDSGPGIPSIERSLGDGFSTGGTPGTGLGAVRRIAQDFDIHSSMPGGTVIVARIRAGDAARPSARICGAAVSVAAPGETRCGDTWAMAFEGNNASMIVADGLGHGPDAAEASEEAARVFAEEPFSPPSLLVEAIHRSLRSTRGAAISVFHADGGAGNVKFSGAGNVLGRIISGISDRTLMCQHGTAGMQIRTPADTFAPWPDHAVLVAHSDGIATRWPPGDLYAVLGRDPALAAAILWRDHCRGRDDATVAVMRRT